MNFRKHLKPKPPKKTPRGIMVRPDTEIMKKLAAIAGEENTSINKVVLAMIKAELEK